MVTVRATLHAARAENRTPPFVVDGMIELRGGAEVRHVPYSLHDCFELRVLANGGGGIAVVHDDTRTWPSKGFLESTWLLPPGDYDAMGFGTGIERPLLLEHGIHVAGDLNVELGRAPVDRTVAWSITDEQGRPLPRAKMDMVVRHTSGALLGFIEFPLVPGSVLPEAGPDYRLEWAVFTGDGPVRRDVAGTLEGPFVSGTQANDPARMRRSLEHFTVAPGDSIVQIEFRMHPDGAGGEFGIALVDLSEPPTTASFDVEKWRSPSPNTGHYRLGRWDLQYHPRALRFGEPDALVALGPLLAVDHGDTVAVHERHLITEPPTLQFTGSRLAFGSGPLVF